MLVPISANGASRIFNQCRRNTGGTDGGMQIAEKIGIKMVKSICKWQEFQFGEECSQNYIIFISDGQWNNNHKVINEFKSLRK